MGSALTGSMVRFPDNTGVMFIYRLGGKLRSGSTHMFEFRGNPGGPFVSACTSMCVEPWPSMDMCL